MANTIQYTQRALTVPPCLPNDQAFTRERATLPIRTTTHLARARRVQCHVRRPLGRQHNLTARPRPPIFAPRSRAISSTARQPLAVDPPTQTHLALPRRRPPTKPIPTP